MIVENFTKAVGKYQVYINSDKDNGYFTYRRTYIYNMYKATLRRIFLKKINFSERDCRRKQDKYLCLNISFLKILSLMR